MEQSSEKNMQTNDLYMLVFKIKRIVGIGAKSLWMHRLRSILTALGIIFGVSSVISMLAIGEGASKDAQEQIARLGSRNIIVKTVKPPEKNVDTNSETSIMQYGLTYEDAERFRQTIPDIEVVVPLRRIGEQARYGSRKAAVEVLGTVTWYLDTSSTKIIKGRFITPTDQYYMETICAVDEKLVDTLFLFDEPIGQHIKINGIFYKVVGVVSDTSTVSGNNSGANHLNGNNSSAESKGSSAGVSGNVYIPITTAKSRFGETQIQISGSSGLAGEKVELQQITVKVSDQDKVLQTRDVLAKILESSHKKEDYQIVVPLELLRQAARTKRIFNIVLGSIAAISLLVGGIGIMNIMLATVSERTREIGIRRALGAKKRDIVLQFLTETVMLTLVGGLLGLVLGLAIPIVVTYFGNMPTVITPGSLFLAFGISAVTGVTFGIYPAYRAANMDPIESLRHE